MLRYGMEARRALDRAFEKMERVMEKDRRAREAAEDEAKTRASSAALAAEHLKHAEECRALARGPAPNEPDGSTRRNPADHFAEYMLYARQWVASAVKLCLRSEVLKFDPFSGGEPVEPLPPDLDRLAAYNIV